MSTTLNLEVEQGVPVSDVLSALVKAHATDIEENDEGLSAYFKGSNTSVWLKRVDDDATLTEDLEGSTWTVGLRLYFDIDPTRENALADIRAFLEELSRLTILNFALSFEYEALYAVNDKGGLHVFEPSLK